MRARIVAVSFALLGALQLGPRSSAAQSREASADSARVEVYGRSDTHLSLFRRALSPGPDGSLIETETAAPVYQYLVVRAEGADVGGAKDALSLEVSAWGRAWPLETRDEAVLEGDVQTAFATVTSAGYSARLGRQQVTGGAARFSRFDGLLVVARAPYGLEASAYTGLTVLPRWNERPGYHHLGAQPEAWLRDPEAAADLDRSGQWLAGGRLSFDLAPIQAALSFHEQREAGELARRNVGLDARAQSRQAALSASAVLDADSGGLADARFWADWLWASRGTLSLEYLHTQPALWLSRQSVLSVFSSDRIDETGASASVEVGDGIRFDGSGYVSLYDDHRPGARCDGSVRLAADHRTRLRLGYVRLLAPHNGYHSLRISLARRLLRRTTGTFEIYGYFYDHAIESYRSSAVYSVTLAQTLGESWEALFGSSLARTPYAGVDLQALARLTYRFDLSGGRE